MHTILSNRWIQKRKPHWERLTSLVAEADPASAAQVFRAVNCRNWLCFIAK
jgi:hypothetical protein